MSGDAWGSALGGGKSLMTGQDPRLCHLGFHYRITAPKKIATRLFHYQITTGTIYMAGWWWRIMLY